MHEKIEGHESLCAITTGRQKKGRGEAPGRESPWIVARGHLQEQQETDFEQLLLCWPALDSFSGDFPCV